MLVVLYIGASFSMSYFSRRQHWAYRCAIQRRAHCRLGHRYGRYSSSLNSKFCGKKEKNLLTHMIMKLMQD